LDSEFPNRRLSTAVTLGILFVLLVVGAVLGFKSLFAPIPSNGPSSSRATCTPQKVDAGKRLNAGDVTVSVFNASNRSGLASETLNKLADRGFKAGDAGNAPDGTKVKFVQVWTTTENDAAAKLVALQFGEGTAVRPGEDLGLGVDVVVGPSYKGLAKAPTSIKTKSTQEVCVPNE
jgi:hypothetical protein